MSNDDTDDDLPVPAGEPAQDAPADPFAALFGGGGPGGGGLDFGALLEQAGQMQAQLMAAKQQAEEAVVEGVAGGGAVRIEVTGALDFRSVTIAPDAVDPDDVELLQDLVLAALRDAADQVLALQSEGLDLDGMGLGGIFGEG